MYALWNALNVQRRQDFLVVAYFDLNLADVGFVLAIIKVE